MPGENANPKYIAIIAAIAVLVLLVGTWLKPKGNQPMPGPTISQAETLRLQRLGQRRSLEGVSSYLAETALNVAPQLVWLPNLESSGLVWSAGGMLLTTHPGARVPDLVAVVATDGKQMEARTTIAAPDLPVMALHIPEGSALRPVAVRPSLELKPGEWVVAVARQAYGGHAFASGWYSGIVPAACGEFGYRRMLSSVSLTEEMRGGGLFDLNGSLVGVIVRCGNSYAAMATEDVNPALRRGTLLDSHLLRRYGLRVEPLGEAAQTYFQAAEGILITEVWKGYPAEAASLNPGDVIVALNEQPVRRLADLEILVRATEDFFELQVRRGRSTVPVTLARKYPATPAGVSVRQQDGIILGSELPGYQVEEVQPNSRVAQAGIRPGDRLLRVGQSQTANLSAIKRALSAAEREPTFIVFERGDRIQGVLLR
ncbi:MAG: PDZ domain-containing protein [Acidobacteria bacterium]|nr:PDZ domain-containing protein [Acidobacteriota bacterium]